MSRRTSRNKARRRARAAARTAAPLEKTGHPRVRGAVLAVLAVLSAAIGVKAALALPGALDERSRYARVLDCGDTVRADCLATVRENVLAVRPGSGRHQGSVTVDSVDFSPGPGMAGRTDIGLDDSETLAKAVHPGDTVLVTWWEGSPLSVTAAGRRFYSGRQPDADAPLIVGGLVSLATAAAVTGWGAARGLRRLPRLTEGTPPSVAVLIAVGLAGVSAGTSRSIAVTMVLQGLVLLVPATVLTRQWLRRPRT